MSKSQVSHKAGFSTHIIRIYLLIVLFALASVIYVGVSFDAMVYQSRGFGEVKTVDNAESWSEEDTSCPLGIALHYRFRLETLFTGTDVISFYAPNCYAEVMIDGIEVYNAQPRPGAWGRTIGNLWVNIPIDQYDSGRLVEVVLKPVTSDFAKDTVTFDVGSYYLILRQQLNSDLPRLILSGIALLVGAVYIGVGLLRDERRGRRTDLELLGLFSLLLGVWKLSDTPSFALITAEAPRAHAYISLVALMLAPTPVILFMQRNLKAAPRLPFRIMAIESLISAAVILVLNAIGVADFRQTLFLTHISLAACVALICWGAYRELKHGNPDKNTRILISLLWLIALGGLVDIIIFNLNHSSEMTIFALAGILVYVVVSGVIMSVDLNRRANVDMQTGLSSRGNSFELLDDPALLDAGVGLIMVDVNNLKATNDTLGHEAGDKLIVRLAKSLKSAVPHDAFVGRTGGDEFIAVLSGTDEESLEIIVGDVRKAAAQIGGTPELSFSAGYAVSVDGETMHELFEKADRRMYVEKKAYHRGAHDRRVADFPDC